MKQIVAQLDQVWVRISAVRPECDGEVEKTLTSIETFDSGVRDELKLLTAQIATTRGNLQGRADEVVAKADGLIPPKSS